MTKDELIELRRERRKQELNIGDKVIVHSASDKPLYDGKVATIIEKGIIGNEVYYGLYIEGEIVEKRSKPLMGAAGIIGTTSLLAPFYAEDLELVKELKFFVGIHPLTEEHARREMEEITSELAANPEKAQQIDKEWEQIKSTKIKVGDKVKVNDSRYNKIFGTFGIVKSVEKLEFGEGYVCSLENGAVFRECHLEPYYSAEDVRRMEEDLQREKEQFLREHSDKDKPHDNTITIPVKSDLDDTYWDAYKAELAKELAVKLANEETITSPATADYITDFVTQIVDNLKKQSE